VHHINHILSPVLFYLSPSLSHINLTSNFICLSFVIVPFKFDDFYPLCRKYSSLPARQGNHDTRTWRIHQLHDFQIQNLYIARTIQLVISMSWCSIPMGTRFTMSVISVSRSRTWLSFQTRLNLCFHRRSVPPMQRNISVYSTSNVLY
jgi:hypothetical protein